MKEGSWCLKKWQAVRTVCQWNQTKIGRTVFYSIQTDKQQLTYKCHSQNIAIGPLVVLEAGLQLPYPSLTFTFSYHLPRPLLSFT